MPITYSNVSGWNIRIQSASNQRNLWPMSVIRTIIFKVLPGPALLFSFLLISSDSDRATASVIFLAVIGCYIHFLFTSKIKWLQLASVAFLIAALLPLDITLQNYPGPPRFVPLVMGTPLEADIARAERGEVVLGGCILRRNAPKWVLVW